MKMSKSNKKLKGDWNIFKFKECITQLNTGLNPRNNFSLGSGNIKYITAKNLTEYGTIDFSRSDCIDETAKNIINKRSDIRVGDILFSSRAPIGHCHLIKEKPDYFDIGESIFSIRPNRLVVLPEYLSLYLTSDLFIKSASKHITGTVIQEIRVGDLMNTQIIVPPLRVQEKIAECIGSIDKKIAINNKINDNLSKAESTLYEYWFLQFEFPNDADCPYKSSGGKMVYNSRLKLNVPQNWVFRSMAGSYIIERGISYTSAEIADGIGVPMLNLACIDKNRNYRDGELKFINGQVSNDKLIQPGDLLIACTDLTRNADIVGCPILVPDDGVRYTYSMDMARLLPDPKIFNGYYLYSALRQPFYHNYIKQYASGTNVMHLNLDGIGWYKMLVPPLSIQQRYGQIVQNMHKERSRILVENRKLQAIRSLILPMLMSGQVTIAD